MIWNPKSYSHRLKRSRAVSGTRKAFWPPTQIDLGPERLFGNQLKLLWNPIITLPITSLRQVFSCGAQKYIYENASKTKSQAAPGGPRRLQEVSGGPRKPAQDGPRRPQEGPGGPRKLPRRAQEGSGGPKTLKKWAQQFSHNFRLQLLFKSCHFEQLVCWGTFRTRTAMATDSN